MAIPGGADLELLLQQFLGQDNTVRRVAEKHLAKALKSPQSIPAFLDRIGGSPHPEVRQLAATLLRKKIGALWAGLRSEDHVAVERALLQSLQAESQRLVRLAVAHLISVVAKFTLPSKRWPELLPFLLQLLQAQEVIHREIAMTLIHALCDRIPTFMRQHLGHLVEVFLKGLADAEMPVRFATLRAVAPVVSLVEEDNELQQIARLLGPTVAVLQEAIERQGHVGQEDESSLELVLSVFEVFDDLAELPLSTVRQHLHGLVQAMLQIAGNSQAHIAVRERAVSIIGSIAADNPKLLARLGLVDPVIQLLIAVLVEHYTADIFRGDSAPNGVPPEDEEDDDFDASGIQFASQLLDQLAGTLPNNVVLPLVLQFAQQQFANPPTPGASPATRRGAVLALSVVCAECRDPLREMVPQLLDLVLMAVSDSEVPVREAACVCLSRFVENLQPEILSHHGRILPVVFQCLDDSNEKLQQKACYMLDKLGEGMERDFVQYLEPVCTRLLALLGRSSTATQAYVVQSLGAIAAGVEDLFKPYAPALLSLVQQVMNSEQPEHFILRARCTEIAGILAGILGEEGFAPYEQELYLRAMVGLRLDCSELREYTFGFLSNLAQIHGKNWAPRLAETVPVVLHAIEQDDGQLRSAPGLFGRDAAVDLHDDEDEAETNDNDDDADEEDESGRPPILRVRTSDLDMKSAALHTLGAFALMTEEHFWPYFERSFEASLKLVQYFHSDVRSNAILSMKNQLAAAYHQNPGLPWRPGNPEVDTLHPETRKPVDFLVTLCLERMENDESKDVVAACCEALVDVLKALGPASLHSHMNKLMDLLMTLLRQKAYCQTREDDEDQGLDDHPDHDQTLIDSVADLVDTLAKAYAAGFTLHMTAVMPELMRYLGPKRPTSDHVMAVGSFAEIAIGMGPAIEPFAPRLMEIFVQGLTSKDAGVRSNAAYGVGALSQQVPALMTPHFPTLLQRLRPLLDDQQPSNVVDNTCACIARMIQTNKDACHLEQVLPVWLARLPLRQDALEHVTVYQCIGFLLREAGDLLGPHQQHIVQLLAHGATHHSTDSACKDLCTGLLGTLMQQVPQLLAEALNGLPPEAQQALRARLGAQVA